MKPDTAIPADCILPAPVEQLSIRSADGSRLNVEVYGSVDAPTVLLAHGWTCSTLFWAPVIHQLAADYRVVAYDQRGHGRSDTPATAAGYSVAKLADDLEAVVTRFVPSGERAVLAGHSMGGMTIMAAADRAEVAARTAAVVLISTGPGDLVAELKVLPDAVRGVGLRRALHRMILESRLPLGPVNGVSNALLKYATMGPDTVAGRVQGAAQVVHACPTGVRHRWSRVLGRLDVYPQLAKLTAPTAVIVGSHDRLTPPVHAHRIVSALPDPRGLLVLPRIGHMSPYERPAEVAAEIRRLATAEHFTPAEQLAQSSAQSSAESSAKSSAELSAKRLPGQSVKPPVEQSARKPVEQGSAAE